MKFILLLFITTAFENEGSGCEIVHFHGKEYQKFILANGLDRPYHLSIYKQKHEIFFSYNIGKNEDDSFAVAYIERGQANATIINEVKNGFATAVDEENHHVYFGGSNGIYKYHLNKKKEPVLEKIITGYNIWYMFFKHELYFINFPSQKLYKYNINKDQAFPEHQAHITEKVYQFLIDKDGDQFISTDSGLYKIKNGTNERTLFSKHKLFRGFALNNEGNAYFCADHTIYATNKNNNKIYEIASVQNVFGLTFAADDEIIYSNPSEIVKLVPGSSCKN